MADFSIDEFGPDDGDDGYERDEEGGQLPQTCRYCKFDPLFWHYYEGLGWRLRNDHEIIHRCKEYQDARKKREDAKPKLLPCPFCGGEGAIYKGTDSYPDVGWNPDPIGVACKVCGAGGARSTFAARGEVIRAWNTRVVG